MRITKACLGTTSLIKAAAAKKIIDSVLNCDIKLDNVDAPSGVNEAPHDGETYLGALNRAKYCLETRNDKSELSIGMESGLTTRVGRLFEEAWAVVIYKDVEYIGYSSGLLVPEVLTNAMETNKITHDKAIKLFESSKENEAHIKDTWALYTNNQISRSMSLEESLRNALVQIVEGNKNMYNLENNA